MGFFVCNNNAKAQYTMFAEIFINIESKCFSLADKVILKIN